MQARRFGLFRVRSPLLTESLLLSLPGGTEMVHFPPLPSPAYEFSGRYSGMSQSGFPHSEIPGSKPACGSPRLIAACHVLRRLLAPRHSPYALSSLTKFSFPHTACVWSKNYRLQSIQLSKSPMKRVPIGDPRPSTFGGQPSRGLPTVAHARASQA